MAFWNIMEHTGSMLGAAAKGIFKTGAKETFGLAKMGAGATITASKPIGSAVIGAGKTAYRGGKSVAIETGAQLLDKGNWVQFGVSSGQVAQNVGNMFASRSKAKVINNIMTGRKEFKDSALQLSGIGKAAIAGAYLYQGSKNAGTEYTAEKMGQIDEHKRTATPMFENSRPIGPLSGGADGSLVFALHNNR